MRSRATFMLQAQSRSGPTAIALTKFERMRRRLTMRKIGNGQSPQCFRKKKTNGRQASKNASQLETTTATEPAKSFSSGMIKSSTKAEALATFFRICSRVPTVGTTLHHAAGGDTVWLQMGAHWLRLVV